MRSSRLFRRIAAGLCAAAMLCGGMAAAAAAPALPAAPAAAETTNASPSDAELKAAFSKFPVTYDEETDKVTLEGKAQLSRSENGQQKDMTSGERIVYDMRNARSEVNSGEGKRVTTIIAPRSKTDAGTQRQGTSLSNSTKLQQ